MNFVSFEPHIIVAAIFGALLIRWLIFNKHSYPVFLKFFTSEKDRLSYAYHEAGHALTLLKLDCGRELEQLTLSPSMQTGFGGIPFYSASHVNSKKLEDNITLEQAYNWLICELSGEAAENLLHDTPGKSRLSAAHDKKTAKKIARHIAKHLPESSIKQLLAKAYMDTGVFMQDNQSALKDLAQALYKHKTLSAQEARTTIGL